MQKTILDSVLDQNCFTIPDIAIEFVSSHSQVSLRPSDLILLMNFTQQYIFFFQLEIIVTSEWHLCFMLQSVVCKFNILIQFCSRKNVNVFSKTRSLICVAYFRRGRFIDQMVFSDHGPLMPIISKYSLAR